MIPVLNASLLALALYSAVQAIVFAIRAPEQPLQALAFALLAQVSLLVGLAA